MCRGQLQVNVTLLQLIQQLLCVRSCGLLKTEHVTTPG